MTWHLRFSQRHFTNIHLPSGDHSINTLIHYVYNKHTTYTRTKQTLYLNCHILKALRKAAKMRNKADPYDTLNDTPHITHSSLAHLHRQMEVDLLKGFSCSLFEVDFMKKLITLERQNTAMRGETCFQVTSGFLRFNRILIAMTCNQYAVRWVCCMHGVGSGVSDCRWWVIVKLSLEPSTKPWRKVK